MKNNFKIFTTIFTIIKNILFPPQCVICDKILEINVADCICTGCKDKLRACVSQVCCEKCGKPIVSFGTKQRCYRCLNATSGHFDKIASAYIYDAPVRESIVRYKSKGIQSYAKTYADILNIALGQHCADLTFDVMCAAPSHRKKTVYQGFDNVELICRYLSKMSGVPFEKGALRKIRQTAKQTTLGFAERLENLRNSMIVPRSDSVAGKTVLLIDDVCTTGATIVECSRALKSAGAKRVYALTLATAILNPPQHN